jgi:nucleoside 2-deoxyribosyltransferase
VTKLPLVYLAGPYSHPDPLANARKMIKVAEGLLRLHVTPIVPHLTLVWHLVRPRSHQFWLEYDLQFLSRADVVLRVPGNSAGADAEVAHARGLRIPVLHPQSARIQDCVSAVRDWILGRAPADQGGADGSASV